MVKLLKRALLLCLLLAAIPLLSCLVPVHHRHHGPRANCQNVCGYWGVRDRCDRFCRVWAAGRCMAWESRCRPERACLRYETRCY